jgi:hypothetical protein
MASKRDYYNENFIITDGVHEAIITQQTFDMAEELLQENRKKYRKWQRREQPVNFMLKGLLRCSNCGATLVYTNPQAHSVQCYKYSARRGCNVSHAISLNKVEPLLIDGLKTACKRLEFKLDIQDTKPSQTANTIEILLNKEQNKLQKIKDAYQSGIDTLEEYKENKQKIMSTISTLKKELVKEKPQQSYNPKKYANKVMNVVKLIESPDVTPQAKNEALRTIISKIVYNKANSTLDIYFYL